jgi:phosphotransferase system HPr (HPr) family protein
VALPRNTKNHSPFYLKVGFSKETAMEVVKKVKIINRLGLHLRAAAKLVKASSQFKCRIIIKDQYREADCKSLINILAIAATYGSEVTLIFEGEDVHNAQEVILDLFRTKFGEKA